MKAFQTLLFYQYTPIADPEFFAAEHQRFCEKNGLLGRIIVASEGLNGTVSGTVLQIRKYKDHLRCMPAFANLEFKIDEVDAPSFERLYVRVKPEIVHSGLTGDKLIDPNRRTGIHLKPEEVDQMLGREDVVFLDVRSNYEHEVGRFRGARTLDIDHFRDFPARIAEIEDLKDKKVVTYCTGGIKCEKASGFLLEQGFKEVYQVEGGIVKYAKETGGSGFEGKLYVFDNRVVGNYRWDIERRRRACNASSPAAATAKPKAQEWSIAPIPNATSILCSVKIAVGKWRAVAAMPVCRLPQKGPTTERATTPADRKGGKIQSCPSLRKISCF